MLASMLLDIGCKVNVLSNTKYPDRIDAPRSTQLRVCGAGRDDGDDG